MALRWKKDKAPTGLARIGCGPLGHSLWDGDVRFATVRASWQEQTKWFWVAGWGSPVPHANTHKAPVGSVHEAKTAALAYVKQSLLVSK
jgi:hypothetical protein